MLLQGTDSIMVVLLQNTGLAADATLVNYQSLGALLAGTSQEATFDNYVRKNLTSSSILVSHNTGSSPTNVSVTFALQIWNSAGGAVNNTISKVALVYQPTSDTADTGCLVLATMDYSGTTTGGSFQVTLGTWTDA
jgi:hypothetical protein